MRTVAALPLTLADRAELVRVVEGFLRGDLSDDEVVEIVRPLIAGYSRRVRRKVCDVLEDSIAEELPDLHETTIPAAPRRRTQEEEWSDSLNAMLGRAFGDDRD